MKVSTGKKRDSNSIPYLKELHFGLLRMIKKKKVLTEIFAKI